MKWKVRITGDNYELEELQKSFSGLEKISITKENDGFYLSSVLFDTCSSNVEVENKAKDIIAVLNGAKTLELGGNIQIEIDYIEFEGYDGSKQIFTNLIGKSHVRGSSDVVIKNSKGEIIEQICPSDNVPNWVYLGLSEENIKKALRLYSKEHSSWNGLYKIYEIIRDDMGGKKTLVDKGWITQTTIKRFTRTANSPSVSGDDARHGTESTDPPPNPMLFSKARSVIDTLLIKWLTYKKTNQRDSGSAL